MAKLLGIDIGTSGCKVLVIDEKGTVLKQASAEYPISVPKSCWTEQNPDDWWSGVESCLAEIDEKSPDAIGVTGQMHGSVFLDAQGKVIRPALLWNDQRTVAECEQIETTIGSEHLKELTCNPALTGFQLPKLLWLRNNEPQNFQQIRQVLLPKDYIRFKLTGDYAAEVSDASGTGIFDVKNRQWSQPVADALGISLQLFPKVYESDEITGHTISQAHLNAGIPVVGGGGDQAAAAVGTGAVEPGIISVSLGTSGVVFTSLPGNDHDPSGAAHTFCHANRGWHAMGVMLSCGGALRWYRDTLGGGRSYDEISASAATAAPGSGMTFLPYLTGERCPIVDPSARASFAGFGLETTRENFDRAVFEGLSFGLLGAFNLLRRLGASATEIRVTSGGSKSDFWVQMLADCFGTPCVRLAVDEGPALGAAILAGVGTGIWPDVQSACKEVVKVAGKILPTGTDYSVAFARYSDLYPSVKPWNHTR
jgi:xylulokinase